MQPEPFELTKTKKLDSWYDCEDRAVSKFPDSPLFWIQMSINLYAKLFFQYFECDLHLRTNPLVSVIYANRREAVAI